MERRYRRGGRRGERDLLAAPEDAAGLGRAAEDLDVASGDQTPRLRPGNARGLGQEDVEALAGRRSVDPEGARRLGGAGYRDVWDRSRRHSWSIRRSMRATPMEMAASATLKAGQW